GRPCAVQPRCASGTPGRRPAHLGRSHGWPGECSCVSPTEKKEEGPPAKCLGHFVTPNGRNRGEADRYPHDSSEQQVRLFPGAFCPSQSLDWEGLAASALVSVAASYP